MALPQPTLAQLRPALELALEAARAAPPGRNLPGPVRSLVRARRLPPRWAVTMARSVDDDGDFRAWLAEGAAEGSLGRVPWLWLTRPEGWEDELAGLVEESAAAEETDKAFRQVSERAAALERELAGAREELERARADQSATAARFEGELRAARREEDGRRQELASDLARMEGERRELAARLSSLEAERDGLDSRVRELERLVAESERGRLRAEERAEGLGRELVELERQGSLLREHHEAHRTQAASAVERAAEAAAELRSALVAAAGALGPAGPVVEAPDTAAQPEGAGGEAPGSPATRPQAGRPRRPGRRPADLPPAMFEESAEAAAHLVRVPGVHLVVDGYNVALTSWSEPLPGRPPVTDLPALRRRLLDALSELAVRVQRTVTVVFDGDDQGGRVAAGGAARRWLRIVFSASSVEADEVILEAVRDLPAHVPVVVATNDREVRDGARSLGANVISVGQLMSVLNRHTRM